jgi:hypothetical protein
MRIAERLKLAMPAIELEIGENALLGKSTFFWANVPFRLIAAGSLLTALSTASPAVAQATDRKLFPSEVTDLMKYNDPNKMFLKRNRIEFVLSINKYCKHINFIFPRNSPDDEKWLNEEINGSFDRKLKAFDSVQYYRDKIKWFTFECLSNSEDYEKKTQKEKVGGLIGLISSFSKISHSDSIKISELMKINNDQSGFFMSNQIMRTIIIAASAENNECDTDAPWCLTTEK